MQVGFTANGSKGTGGSVSGSTAEQKGDHANYFILSGNQTTGRLELRVKDIFFTRGSGTNSGFSLIAGITPIRNVMFPTLSGSQGYLGIG